MRISFRLGSLIVIAAVLSSLWPASPALANQAPSREKGLLISPLRQFLSVQAGGSQKSSFTVANLTNQPLKVSLSVQQFSVTNYTYNYQFSQPANNWLHIDMNSFALEPNQTKSTAYSFQVPAGSTPGGHYYTLIASANLNSQGVNSTIQAADLIYLTVNGRLLRTSYLQKSSIQRLSFGRTIPFNLQAVDNGNVYAFVYVSGKLHGLLTRPTRTPAAHLLMPGKPRVMQDSIPAPLLPGVYRATYGYRTADANWVVQESRFIVYIPPWSIALMLAVLLVLGKAPRYLARHRKKHSSKQPTDKQSNT